MLLIPLLIAAGGGGGAGGYLETTINPHLQDGKDAVSGTSGTDPQAQGPGAGFTSLGQGGSSGNGGTGGSIQPSVPEEPGFLQMEQWVTIQSGLPFICRSKLFQWFCRCDGRGKPNGGFGGGGSTSHGGGGGGGYSGGGGGGVWTHPGGADWGYGGGGGGSYNSGADQNNTADKYWAWKGCYHSLCLNRLQMHLQLLLNPVQQKQSTRIPMHRGCQMN